MKGMQGTSSPRLGRAHIWLSKTGEGYGSRTQSWIFTVGVGRSFDDVQKTHVGYIINVNFGLEDDNKRFTVQLDGKNRGREKKFTNH